MGNDVSALNIQMGSEEFRIPDLKSDFTIFTLKNRIFAYSGIHIKNQVLTYGSNVLEDSRTLSSYQMKNYDTLKLDEKLRAMGVLYIETVSGTKYASVDFNPNKSISNVKQMIQEKSETPTTQQKLYFDDVILRDESTLSAYNIQEGAILKLEITPLKKGVIMVEMSECPVIELRYNPNQTVENLKHDILTKNNIPSDEQRLFFKDLHLEERKTLANYDIFAENVLKLTKRPKSELLIYVEGQPIQNFMPTNTIHDIKERIQQESKVLIREQCLKWEDTKLEDKNTLAYYNIQDGAKLRLTQVMSKIFVKFRDENIGLGFNPDLIVLTFKGILTDRTGVPQDEQELIFAGKKLENDKKLSDYDIQKENLMHLIWSKPKREIEIMVKTPGKEDHPMSVLPETRISELKLQIANHFKTLPADQLLTFQELPLADERTLDSYNINDGSCVLMGIKQNNEGLRNRSITLPCGLMSDPFGGQTSSEYLQSEMLVEPPPPPYDPLAGLPQIEIRSGTLPVATPRNPELLQQIPLPVNIKVSVLCSNTFDLRITRDGTILRVKTKIAEKKGFDIQIQKIYFKNALCEDDATLPHLGIGEDSEIEVDILQVWKVEINSQFHAIHCYSQTKISKFKEEIEGEIGIASQMQHLFSNGIELLDNETLLHYGLKPQDPIALLTFVSVNIQFLHGKSIAIPKCSLHQTTGKLLKNKICEQCSIPFEQLTLTYQGREVVDCQTLDGIKYESNKHITAGIDVEKSDEISLLIRVPTGDIQLIRLRTLDTVGKIKNRVNLHKNLANAPCYCMIGDRRLSDEDVLRAYDIRELTQIDLIPPNSTFVNLVLMDGASKCFGLSEYDSVEETVRRINNEFYQPAEHNRLFYGREKLIYFTHKRISNGDDLFIGPDDSFLITVQPELSRPIKLLVNNDETVFSLKEKIEQRENFPLSLQILTFCGTEMKNGDPIRKFNLMDNPIVILKLSGLNSISIYVSDQCDNTVFLDSVSPYSKVSELRAHILNHSKISDRSRFVFEGKILPGFSPLCAHIIKNGSRLMILGDRKNCLANLCNQQPPPVPKKQRTPEDDSNFKRVFRETVPIEVKPRTRTCYGDGPDRNMGMHFASPPPHNYCINCQHSVCICTQNYGGVAYPHGPRMHADNANSPQHRFMPYQPYYQNPAQAYPTFETGYPQPVTTQKSSDNANQTYMHSEQYQHNVPFNEGFGQKGAYGYNHNVPNPRAEIPNMPYPQNPTNQCYYGQGKRSTPIEQNYQKFQAPPPPKVFDQNPKCNPAPGIRPQFLETYNHQNQSPQHQTFQQPPKDQFQQPQHSGENPAYDDLDIEPESLHLA